MAAPNRNVAERALRRLADFLARHSRVLAIAAIVSVALPAWWLRRIETYNSIETWLLRRSPEYRRYQSFLATFGSEEYVVVAATMDDPFSEEGLSRQQQLAERLEALSGVDGVLSLPRFAASVWPGRADWRDQALNTPFLKNLLIGPDEKTVGVLAWFKPSKTKGDRERTVNDILAVAAKESGPGFVLHPAGIPLVNVALNRTCVRDLSLFVPMAFAVAVAVLAVMLRSPGRILSPLAAVVSTLIWTLGLMSVADVTLNMVTVTLPPLLTVLVLSNGLHLASRFGDKLASLPERREAIRETLRELVRPAMLASATTAVGCGSLYVAEMQPVKEMGLFAGVGILIGLAMNLLMVPGLLVMLPGRPAPVGRAWTHWSSRTGAAVTRHAWAVVPAAAVVVAVCGINVSRITIKPHVLRFLPRARHTKPQDERERARSYVTNVRGYYEYVNQYLTGFYSIEIEARADPADEDAVLGAMDRLDASLGKRPDVARTVHIGQIVPYIDRALLVGATNDGEQTTRFLNDIRERFRQKTDGRVALRQSIMVREYEGIDVGDLIDTTVAEARREIPPVADVHITGIVPLLKQAERGLVKTQIKSFSWAAGISLAVIAILFWSFRAFAAAILPNLLPVVGTFALMATIGIPLDVATVMIASISIAIAVDDTIHFLERYQASRRRGLDAAASASEAFAKAGRAMVFTSVVAATGFMMLVLSSFVPMANLGFLSAIAMLTALAGDLFILPASARLVNLWAPRPDKPARGAGKT